MRTCAELVEEARLNLEKFQKKPTFYRLAAETGCHSSLIKHWREGRVVWTDENALKFKELLPYPPEVLLLWAHMEREKSPEVLAVLSSLEKRVSTAA